MSETSAENKTQSESNTKNTDSSHAADGRFAPVEVHLKNRKLAAIIGWLWPGAGHLYQGRYGKGVLFMACILGTYFWGLAMGGGHVVYASLRPGDMRLYYAGQVNVGIPALPAIPQAMSMSGGGDPIFGDWMAPPRKPLSEGVHDHRATWHEKLGFYFELGTLFTTVAGLLNLLAVYDAYSGPAFGPWDGQGDRVAGAPPGSEERPPTMVESFTSGFGFFGGMLGFIVGLTIRGGIDVDDGKLGYLFAIGGIGVGWAIGRGLQWSTQRLFGVTPTTDESSDANNDEAQK